METVYRAVSHRLIRTLGKIRSVDPPNRGHSARAPAARCDEWFAAGFAVCRPSAQSSTRTSASWPYCPQRDPAFLDVR